MSNPRFTVSPDDLGRHGEKNRVFIYDDEFHWDGMLEVTGDFGELADRDRYAKAICDALNATEIPSE